MIGKKKVILQLLVGPQAPGRHPARNSRGHAIVSQFLSMPTIGLLVCGIISQNFISG